MCSDEGMAGMTRAQLRRKKREQEKAKTATYNLTQAQLDAMIEKGIGERLNQIRQEATDKAVNAAMVLLLTLPLEVLMDYYWPKSYRQRLPGFVGHVLEYYGKWQDGELDMDEMKKDLWEYGGVRLEESDADNEKKGE